MTWFSPKIGIALGGGGAKGAAHLGVLNYFVQKEIEISAISGTSAGAIVGALYAFGLNPEEIKNALLELDPISIRSLRIGELGLLQNLTLEKMLKKYLPENAQIEHAQIPLAIHATDLVTGKGVDFYSGPVLTAVLASSSVPGIYVPQEYQKRLLVDGGLTENVPVSSLKKLGARALIAVNLNGQEKYQVPESLFDCIANSIDIAIDNQTNYQIRNADIKIQMDLIQFSRYDLKQIDTLIQQGYSMTEKTVSRAYKITFFHYANKFIRLMRSVIPPVLEKILNFKH